MAATAARSTMPGFVHEALFYEDDHSFLEATVPFLLEGARSQEPMLVAIDERKISLLKDALGDEAERVTFADMARLGANPARIIPAWLEFASGRATGQAVRGIGEPIWPGRSADELVECQLHEELLNVAFADTPAFQLLCPYDTRQLPDAVLEGARRSHPQLVHDGRRSGSDAYCGHEECASIREDGLPDFGRPQVEFAFDSERLADVRAIVDGVGLELDLELRRRRDFVLAVNEIAANSVRHGGGAGSMRLWAFEDRLVCEILDRGRIDDPLVGRRKPKPLSTGGYGVWLANQVCELVQVRSNGAGTRVRLHLHR